MAKIEWVTIKKWAPEPIGAIGFIDNDVVAVVAFFDDRDGDKDGDVSLFERAAFMLSPVSMKGGNVVEVAMQARVDMDVVMRDPSFDRMAMQMFVNFAQGLVMDGIYAAYFSRGVSMAGKGVAKMITGNMIKGFVIRKGFESAVKKAFKEATEVPGS